MKHAVDSIHFVGVGGSGMSGIAEVLANLGYRVSGSDLADNATTRRLASLGIRTFVGHAAGNIQGADVVVTSTAVKADNPEVIAAREKRIPVVPRAMMLAELMRLRKGIAIAGTHGKTTTTAMIVSILLGAGRDPSYVVGGIVAGLDSNAHAGAEPLFVIEADEYDRTFLSLTPEVAVITNVEHDHPDCYPTFEDFRAAFESFAGRLSAGGLLVACADDPVAREIAERRRAEGGAVALFGLGAQAEWRAEEIRPNFAGGNDFLAVREGRVLGLARLRQPGVHNVSNAMAALAVADRLGVSFRDARNALIEFRGVGRRFEVKGEAQGVTVVDDYAHHPTEIRATLAAAQAAFPERPLWAVWQPHTYSRTKALLPEFAHAFGCAQHVVVLPVYAARETDELGLANGQVAAAIQATDVHPVGSLQQAVELLRAHVQAGDVVLTLGAGDGDAVGVMLLDALKEGPNDERTE